MRRDNRIFMNYVISKKGKEIFAFFFALSFILNSYSSGIDGISLGAVIHIIYAIVSIVLISKYGLKIGKNAVQISPILLAIIFTVISMIDIVFLPSSETSLLNIFKELGKVYLWGFSICIVNYIFFDVKHLKKWFVRIGVVSTIFLFVQFLVWTISGIAINGIVDFVFLKPYDMSYITNTGAFYATLYRPSSFFSEPAFYSNFIFAAMILVLVNSDEIKEQKIHYIATIIFFSAGILISASTAGVILLFFLFCLYYKNYILKNLFSFFIGVGFLLVLSCSVWLASDYFTKDTFIGKYVVAIDQKIDVMDHSRRFGRSYDALDYLNDKQKIFGVGFGNEVNVLPPNSDLYMNTVTMMIFSVGGIGLLLFVIFIMRFLISSRNYIVLFLIVTYIVKCVNGAIGFSLYGILFLGLTIFLNFYWSHANKNYNINYSRY